MKTLVIYYSYTGHTKEAAIELAAKEAADITEVKDVRRKKAFPLGCLAAIRGKAWPIQALDKDPAAYDRLIILSPIWAGNPPPAVNGLFAQLPKGKKISVKMNSAGGQSNCRERVKKVIKLKGCVLEGYEDIRVPGKDAG